MQIRKLMTAGLIMFVMAALLGIVTPASADEGDPISFTGTVTAIVPASGTINVQVLESSQFVVYLVYVPAGFDFSLLELNDEVAVVGTLDGNGNVLATQITILSDEGDPISFTGTVTAIDEAAGTIHVQVLEVSQMVVYLVYVPAGFDFSLLEPNDVVDVVGTLDANGNVVATQITIHPGEGDPIEFTGTVTAIDQAAGTIHVQVLESSQFVVYLVYVPAGFDFGLLELNDTVHVVGTLDANGDVIATEITILDDDEGEYNKDNYFCQNPDARHPVGLAIANEYGVTYEEVMAWFCGVGDAKGVGFGQIMLALQSAAATDDPADTFDMYLTLREDQGWGKIWQGLGLIGNPNDAEPPDDGGSGEEVEPPVEGEDPNAPGRPEDTGKPENTGRPENTGNSENNGRPEDTGRPENTGRPEDAGRPEDTGRPADTGNQDNNGKSGDNGKP